MIEKYRQRILNFTLEHGVLKSRILSVERFTWPFGAGVFSQENLEADLRFDTCARFIRKDTE